jgi:NTP pyrophosphatase (non-canonical NTP hydrolase)
MSKDLNQLAQEIHANAKSKGFFDEPKNIGEMLCLIHSEVSEALEAERKEHYARIDLMFKEAKGLGDKAAFEMHVKNSFEDELADVIIRCLDLAAFKGIDIQRHVELKMAYNATREHKHGKKF